MADPDRRPASALPSVRARALAFSAILLGGAAGAAIGGSFMKVECHHACDTPVGIGAVVGGAAGAGGTGVVAVLTLRAMGEWRRISDDALAGDDDDASPGDDDDASPGDDDQDGVRSRKPSA